MCRSRITFIIVIILSFSLFACATGQSKNTAPFTDAEKGIMLGAAIGVLAGLTTKNKKKKAILYGITGGIAGGAIGSYMDKQKQDFEKQLKAHIQRGDVTIDKLPNNVVIVTMTAQTTFAVNSTAINSEFHSALNKIATIVKKYAKTHLSIVGHTDSSGSKAYNQKLSLRRAKSVYRHLGHQGVSKQRRAYYGMGENKPRADNASARGKTLNRRVDIVIEPIAEKE